MEKPINDLLHFTLRLREFLDISFPEKVADKKFIEQRALWATETFERAFRLGDSIERCNQAADSVLFKDLHFSKFDLVLQVVSNEFSTAFFDEELKHFALRMLFICQQVFEKYPLNDDSYGKINNSLYTELRETIARWIEENRS